MKVLGLSAVLAVGLATVAFADHVQPVGYGDDEGEENNPSCAFLDPSWNEVKVNQAPNGDHPDSGGGENPGGEGPLVFTVENSDGKTFDWKANMGVDAVVVKGGNRGANVYFYDPEETADQRLRSPDNTQGNQPAISHISACYDTEATQDEPGGGGDQGGGEQQGEQPRDEGDGRDEDQGGNQRPAEPDEPQGDRPQDNADDQGDDEPGDRRGGNERPAEGDEPKEDGGTDDTERDRGADEQGDAEEPGESEVEGVSETDDGEADDVTEETAAGDEADSDDDLPFTGAPLGIVLLLGVVLMLAGVAARIVTR